MKTKTNISLFLKQIHVNFILVFLWSYIDLLLNRGRRGRYRMVIGFTTTYAISAYHH